MKLYNAILLYTESHESRIFILMFHTQNYTELSTNRENSRSADTGSYIDAYCCKYSTAYLHMKYTGSLQSRLQSILGSTGVTIDKICIQVSGSIYDSRGCTNMVDR